jgi:hypothetical protein
MGNEVRLSKEAKELLKTPEGRAILQEAVNRAKGIPPKATTVTQEQGINRGLIDKLQPEFDRIKSHYDYVDAVQLLSAYAALTTPVRCEQQEGEIEKIDKKIREQRLRNWRDKQREKARSNKETFFLDFPDSWYEPRPVWADINGHISHRYLKTNNGDVCLECHEPIWLVPNDTTEAMLENILTTPPAPLQQEGALVAALKWALTELDHLNEHTGQNEGIATQIAFARELLTTPSPSNGAIYNASEIQRLLTEQQNKH